MSPSSPGALPRTLVALGLVVALLAVSFAAVAQTVGPTPSPVVTPSRPTQPTPTPTPPDVGPPLPDLVVSNVVAHQAPDERSPTQVCTTVANIGYDGNAQLKRSSTGTQGFEIYLRLDQGFFDENGTQDWLFAAENYARENAPLPGGPSSTTDPTSDQAEFCWNFTLPAGNYRWFVFVDDKDEVQECASSNPDCAAEKNNIKAPQRVQFGVRAVPTPDLIVSRLVITPRDAKPGDYQAFQLTVANIGTATSTFTHLEVKDDTGLISRQPIGALGSGKQQNVVFVTRPDLRPPGSHFAVATVDPEGNVTESNETNNVLGAVYRSAPHPEPDLTIGNVTLNGTLEARHGIRLDGTLLDIGNASAANVTVRLYLDGTPAKNFTIPTVVTPTKPGNFSFFFVLTAGNHTLDLVADPDDSILEFSKDNNRWNETISIAVPASDLALPNLVVDRLDAAPLDPSPNELVNITGLVENIGEKRSNDTTVEFYLGSKVLGSVHVGPVNPDRAVSFRFPWTQPPVGPYEIRVIVDPDNRVNETDETDNNDTLPFQIAPPPGPETPPPTPNGTLPGANETLPGTSDINNTPPVTLVPSNDAATLDLPQLELTTRPVPGGLKGVAKVSLRNPTIEPIGRVTVTFRVDGEDLKTVLVNGLEGAGTTSVSSDEIDLPPGTHTLVVSAIIVGPGNTAVNATKLYTADAGAKSFVPLGIAPLVGGVLIAAAFLWPRRR